MRRIKKAQESKNETAAMLVPIKGIEIFWFSNHLEHGRRANSSVASQEHELIELLAICLKQKQHLLSYLPKLACNKFAFKTC